MPTDPAPLTRRQRVVCVLGLYAGSLGVMLGVFDGPWRGYVEAGLGVFIISLSAWLLGGCHD